MYMGCRQLPGCIPAEKMAESKSITARPPASSPELSEPERKESSVGKLTEKLPQLNSGEMAESIDGSGQRLCQSPPPLSLLKSPEPELSDVGNLAIKLSRLNPFAKEFVPASNKATARDARGEAGWTSTPKLPTAAPCFVTSGKLIDRRSCNAGNSGSSCSQHCRAPLNPLAADVVLGSSTTKPLNVNGEASLKSNQTVSADAPEFKASGELINAGNQDACKGESSGIRHRKRRNRSNRGLRNSERMQSAQDNNGSIKRTIYVSDIDYFVSEENLAAFFSGCGKVVECRICGDPRSHLQFAFIEFDDDYGAKAALTLSGMAPWHRPLRILPSKTSILPVNSSFLPQSADEREMCMRTVYVNNIDKKVSIIELKIFFQKICGEVSRSRLLGGPPHSPFNIAFVEFVRAESAMAALHCSGRIVGEFPIRVSPSKTPVRLHQRRTQQT